LSLTLLGFDYGTRKIGVAAGQTITRTAQGVAVVSVTLRGGHWTEIDQLVTEWKPDKLVVGLPVQPGGTTGDIAEQAKDFGDALAQRYGLPVDWVDETLTSAFADTLLQASAPEGKSLTRRRKSARDQIAAALILETWMNQHADSAT
jgi:putative Holliday junction resolvase